jgi:hypothetical protein
MPEEIRKTKVERIASSHPFVISDSAFFIFPIFLNSTTTFLTP